MFWLRNRKIIILLLTLNLRSAVTEKIFKWDDYIVLIIQSIALKQIKWAGLNVTVYKIPMISKILLLI